MTTKYRKIVKVKNKKMIEEIYHITQSFYKQHLYRHKQHLYRQRQAETGSKSRAKAKLHPQASRYFPKIIGDILKNAQKQVCLFQSGYMINDNKNKAENEK